MSPKEFSTYQEIKSQPEAWVEALSVTKQAHLPQASDYNQVIFTGCGSAYSLSLAAAALYQELTGRPARAAPAGELFLYSNSYLTWQTTLLIAVSRSGTTTETVKAVEKFKSQQRGAVIVLSNYAEALSSLADTSLVITTGQEQSVAQTRSFASLYVAATTLCARMAERQDLLSGMDELPESGERLISKYESCAKEIAENPNFDRFYFLGSGIRYGLACEVTLKMKEMSLTHSEPFHFLEFRHGPMSMVNPHTVVVGLLSEINRSHEVKVLAEMAQLGARVVSLGESNAEVAFESGIPESVRGVLYLPVLQMLAYYRSIQKGLNPDQPHNLTAVVKLIF